MATTFTNVSPEDRDVSVDGALKFVAAGGTFDVPDEVADAYRGQPHFKESKTKKSEGN